MSLRAQVPGHKIADGYPGAMRHANSGHARQFRGSFIEYAVLAIFAGTLLYEVIRAYGL